jgi:hypothetical protein
VKLCHRGYGDRVEQAAFEGRRDFYMHVIIKVGNYLQAFKKIELSQVLLLQTLLPSTQLPSDLTLTVLKCSYEKSKIPHV